jgi:hypothetical protein
VALAQYRGKGTPVHMMREMRENGLPEWDIQGVFESTKLQELEFDDSE